MDSTLSKEQGLVSCSSLPKVISLKYVIQLKFPVINNIAEYEWLATGLWLAKELGVRRLLITGDS
jgi:hypothetical protein